MITTQKYLRATTVGEAISLAREHDHSFRYLAGGTDVMVNKYQGNDESPVLIDISGLAELKNILATETRLVIGSLTTLHDLVANPLVNLHFPILAEAAASIAAPVIRKTATLGGNLLCENRCSYYNQSEWWRASAGRCLKCNGTVCLATGGGKKCFSKFVSDSAVALIALGASIEIYDGSQELKLPLEEIYSGDGVNSRSLSPTAIITAINVPLKVGAKAVYKKLRKRESLDFTSLTTTVYLDSQGKTRIVLGGVHAKPVVVDGDISGGVEELIRQTVSGSHLVDNDTYSKEYRREMITVLLNRSFQELTS